MDIRTLENLPFAGLHAAFLAAFTGYAVPFELTASQLAELHRRRGVRLDLSVGVFDGADLAGFTCNGFGPWLDAPAGYDAGTGVVPAARGKGLASLMMARSLEILKNAGAKRYVLEVLQSNETAFRVYERIGLRVTRELLCWSLDVVRSRPGRPASTIERVSSLDGILASGMHDWTPSWQNADPSIARAGEDRAIFVARDGEDVAGYAVVFASGDLAQFAVARSHRRGGVATALMRAARRISPRPLRIVNTDGRDDATTKFLGNIGATETVRQYEMAIDL